MRSRLRALVSSSNPPVGAGWREFGSAVGIRKPGKSGLAQLMAASADVLPELDDAIAWLSEVEQADLTFEVPPIDANQPLREALAHRGFFPRRFQAVLACEPRIVDFPLPTGVDIRAPHGDEMAAYMHTFMEGFRDRNQTWSDVERQDREREMIQEYGDPGCWRLVLATIDGEHAGIGTLWLDSSTAFFSNGATVPRFRRRGVHGTLISARLNEAALAGAGIVYVDTTVSSAAERNLRRYGFRLVCHLGMWSRLPTSE
jgi:GNAT superfamily N-acetyltransferase